MLGAGYLRLLDLTVYRRQGGREAAGGAPTRFDHLTVGQWCRRGLRALALGSAGAARRRVLHHGTQE